MNPDVPYMLSVTNVHKILDAIQRAGAPEVFHLDFLKDLGFKASNDRGAVKLLKYLGLLDGSGRPQSSYREFMDHTKAKQILAARMRVSFDDLFTADRNANTKSVEQLKGWFKTKTGAGDAVAQKMASTFRSLATYASWDGEPAASSQKEEKRQEPESVEKPLTGEQPPPVLHGKSAIGLVYRFEIHLPDTQNVDTFRAIFRALREELM
jgi:hypothetical protein